MRFTQGGVCFRCRFGDCEWFKWHEGVRLDIDNIGKDSDDKHILRCQKTLIDGTDFNVRSCCYQISV